MTIESKQLDVVTVLTGMFAAAYIGGAVFALVMGKIDYDKFLAVVGAPALPLFGYWIRGKQ
ncbi:hypothetical protein [Ideonella sp.]|uniref:hypothetical protein n=1 Tax=Ideonella sp. TaxID=1929293 RepID=UPI003BB812B2